MRRGARFRPKNLERRRERLGKRLSEISVNARTLQRYRFDLQKAFQSWNFCQESCSSISSFGYDLAEYIDIEFAFEEGETLSHAGNVLSAFQLYLPMLRKKLVYSWHIFVFGLWKRFEKSWQATPVTPELLHGMLGFCLESGRLCIMLLLEIGFHGL